MQKYTSPYPTIGDIIDAANFGIRAYCGEILIGGNFGGS